MRHVLTALLLLVGRAYADDVVLQDISPTAATKMAAASAASSTLSVVSVKGGEASASSTVSSGNPFPGVIYTFSCTGCPLTAWNGAVTQGPLTWIDNVAYVGGSAVSTGTGVMGPGTLRVTVATDSTGQIMLTPSAANPVTLQAAPGINVGSVASVFPTWTITGNVNATLQGSQTVTGTVTANVQSIWPTWTITGNVNATLQGSQTVTGTVTANVQSIWPTWTITGNVNATLQGSQTVTGTVTANVQSIWPTWTITGNVNATLQGSQTVTGTVTANVQSIWPTWTITGSVTQGPAAAIANSWPVINAGITQGGTVPITISALLGSANPGVTATALVVSIANAPSVNQAGAPWSSNVTQWNGTTVDTNSGTKSNGTLRVVLATDQPALTNAQPVQTQAGTQLSVSATGEQNGTVTMTNTSTANVIDAHGILKWTFTMSTTGGTGATLFVDVCDQQAQPSAFDAGANCQWSQGLMIVGGPNYNTSATNGSVQAPAAILNGPFRWIRFRQETATNNSVAVTYNGKP